MSNHELIDVRETTVPFWQISEVCGAIRSIRTYEYIINNAINQYKKHIAINPIGIQTTMEVDSAIGMLEGLRLYNSNYYSSIQRNRDLANIEQALRNILPTKQF